MEYTLKKYDIPLLKFSAIAGSSEPEIKFLWWNAEKTYFLPLDLELTPEELERRLRHRTIPRNRAYVHNLLAKLGLNLNRPMSTTNLKPQCHFSIHAKQHIPHQQIALL